MKQLVLILLFVGLAAVTPSTALSAETAPKSVIHVVTVTWKEGTTPQQIQAALDGVKKLAQDFKGISRVWVKTLKAQGDRTHAIVMEFADEAALQAYANSPAQQEWYKAYIPIREASTTFDITN